LIREPSVEAREAEAVALVGDGRVAVCAATEAALPSPPSEGAVKTAVNVTARTEFLRGAAMLAVLGPKAWAKRGKNAI